MGVFCPQRWGVGAPSRPADRSEAAVVLPGLSCLGLGLKKGKAFSLLMGTLLLFRSIWWSVQYPPWSSVSLLCFYWRESLPPDILQCIGPCSLPWWTAANGWNSFRRARSNWCDACELKLTALATSSAMSWSACLVVPDNTCVKAERLCIRTFCTPCNSLSTLFISTEACLNTWVAHDYPHSVTVQGHFDRAVEGLDGLSPHPVG